MTTAIRTWNKARTKATLTVTFPDGRTATAGGNRAARAEAVILYAYTAEDEPGLLGCRQDLAAAQKEAHRLTTATSARVRSPFGADYTRPIIPAHYAEAIPVVDAEQETQP